MQRQKEVQAEEEPDRDEQQQAAPRKGSRSRKKPDRLGTSATEQQIKQLSPRQKKQRQAQAKFGLKKRFVREEGQWAVGSD